MPRCARSISAPARRLRRPGHDGSSGPAHRRGGDARGRGPRRLVRRGAHPVRPFASRRTRRGRRADGPQRRRQVDHHEGADGAAAAPRRHGAVLRRGHLAAATLRDRAPRPRLRPRGPAHLRSADRRREPRRRPPAAAALRRRPRGAGVDRSSGSTRSFRTSAPWSTGAAPT